MAEVGLEARMADLGVEPALSGLIVRFPHLPDYFLRRGRGGGEGLRLGGERLELARRRLTCAEALVSAKSRLFRLVPGGLLARTELLRLPGRLHALAGREFVLGGDGFSFALGGREPFTGPFELDPAGGFGFRRGGGLRAALGDSRRERVSELASLRLGKLHHGLAREHLGPAAGERGAVGGEHRVFLLESGQLLGLPVLLLLALGLAGGVCRRGGLRLSPRLSECGGLGFALGAEGPGPGERLLAADELLLHPRMPLARVVDVAPEREGAFLRTGASRHPPERSPDDLARARREQFVGAGSRAGRGVVCRLDERHAGQACGDGRRQLVPVLERACPVGRGGRTGPPVAGDGSRNPRLAKPACGGAALVVDDESRKLLGGQTVEDLLPAGSWPQSFREKTADRMAGLRERRAGRLGIALAAGADLFECRGAMFERCELLAEVPAAVLERGDLGGDLGGAPIVLLRALTPGGVFRGKPVGFLAAPRKLAGQARQRRRDSRPHLIDSSAGGRDAFERQIDLMALVARLDALAGPRDEIRPGLVEALLERGQAPLGLLLGKDGRVLGGACPLGLRSALGHESLQAEAFRAAPRGFVFELCGIASQSLAAAGDLELRAAGGLDRSVFPLDRGGDGRESLACGVAPQAAVDGPAAGFGLGCLGGGERGRDPGFRIAKTRERGGFGAVLGREPVEEPPGKNLPALAQLRRALLVALRLGG